jgi:hypothetical protein
MYPISSQEAEYQKLFFQMRESRKQLISISKELERYQDLNHQSLKKIEDLQKELDSRSKEVHFGGSESLLLNESISLEAPAGRGSLWPGLDSTFQTSSPEEPESKNTLFEYFFVIEADPNTVHLGENKAKVCYSYPSEVAPGYKKLCKELKRLIFPSGIQGDTLDDKESKMDQVSYVLYKSRERDENSFIVSFDPVTPCGSFDRTDVINNGKQQLYCCCVKFRDISAEFYEKQLMVVWKCYCFFTYFPCFDLHFDVLDRLLLILRVMISDKSQHQLVYFEDYNDIDLIFGNSEEGLGLLESYFDYYSDGQAQLFSDICVGLQTGGFVDYQFPSDCYYLDKKWTCSLLFSVFSLHDLWFFIQAAMMDKNIVIVFDDLDALTSAVLGLQGLLMPLVRTSNVYTLKAASNLSEIVSKGTSFMVGVSSLSQSEYESLENVFILKVNQSHNEVFFNSSHVNVKKPSSVTYSLMEKLKDDYANFNREHLYKRTRDIPKKNLVYTNNDEQSSSQERIVEEIRKFVAWVVEEIKSCCDTRPVDWKSAAFNLKGRASLGNQEFFLEILKSEGFKYLLNRG